MSRYTHDIVATIGEYTNNQGETKKRYTKCGAAFTDDDGRLSLKLDTTPCSPEWSGWLSLYPKKDSDAPRQQKPASNQQPAQQPAAQPDNDDIPF